MALLGSEWLKKMECYKRKIYQLLWSTSYIVYKKDTHRGKKNLSPHKQERSLNFRSNMKNVYVMLEFT